MIEMKTTDEFISHYYEKLKNDLSLSNIFISKTGYTGFILSVLGNMQSDIKTYYDNLFKESFPITASENKNLLYHANLYGFNPNLATSSYLTGNFKLDFNSLTPLSKSIKKRIFTFEDVQLNLNGIIYNLDSNYKIETIRTSGENFIYNVEISDESSSKKYQITKDNPYFPIKNFIQYEIQEESFYVDKYTYGSHYTYTTENVVDYISDIKVYVKENDSNEYIEYKCQMNKDFYTGYDEVIIFSILPNNDILLELGSGIHGKYIPLSDVKVEIYKTKGEGGNISSINTSNVTGTIIISDYNDNGELISVNNRRININKLISIEIEKGYGGTNPLIGEKLRNSLIKYIQSRDNLISQQDFNNILSTYLDEFQIIFKKTTIVENIFYIYYPLKNKENLPILSTSYSISEEQFKNSSTINSSTNYKYYYKPEIVINNKTFISPFLYFYNSVYRMYEGYLVIESPTFYPYDVTSHNGKETPLVFLELEFNGTNTKFWIKSPNDITEYILRCSIQNINEKNKIMSQSDEFFYFEYINGGVFENEYFEVNFFKNNILEFTYKFKDLTQIVSVKEILKLRTFIKDNGESIVLNVPLIEKNEFIKDENYYINKIISDVIGLNVKENSMVSDEIQLRFCNSNFIHRDYLKEITLQEYYFDLQLPLLMYLDIIINKKIVLSNNLNVEDLIFDLKYQIANYLNNEINKIDISFYKSKIIDLIHNLDWVKSVIVVIKDSNGRELIDGNIESLTNNEISEKLNKEKMLEYTPTFFWFNINAIDVNYKLLD